MKKLTCLTFVIVTLAGCTGVINRFDLNGIGTLEVTRLGCHINTIKFTNNSGSPQQYPYFTLLALDKQGNTLDTTEITCDAAIPNGKSNCRAGKPFSVGSSCTSIDNLQVMY